jgi:hypothetical protein
VNNAKVVFFADDTKLFKCVDSHIYGASIQSDLDNLEEWSTSSGLVFNQIKCKCHRITRKKITTEFPYTIKNKTLAVTTEEKDLGIWVTSNLKWSKHTLDAPQPVGLNVFLQSYYWHCIDISKYLT